jgi:hypothetical protein
MKSTGIAGESTYLRRKTNIWFYLVIAIVIMALYYLIIRCTIPDVQHRGLFGDTFGAISALFSGGALIGVIISLFIQREELAINREELKLNREELKKSVEAQEGSKEALEEQVRAHGRTALVTAYTYLADYNEKIAEKVDPLYHERVKYTDEAKKYRNGLIVILSEIEWLSGLHDKNKK